MMMSEGTIDEHAAARMAAGQAVVAIALGRSFIHAIIGGPGLWPFINTEEDWIGEAMLDDCDPERSEKDRDDSIIIEMGGWLAMFKHLERIGKSDCHGHEGFAGILDRIGEAYCGGDEWYNNPQALEIQSKVESVARKHLESAPGAVEAISNGMIIVGSDGILIQNALYDFCVDAVNRSGIGRESMS